MRANKFVASTQVHERHLSRSFQSGMQHTLQLNVYRAIAVKEGGPTTAEITTIFFVVICKMNMDIERPVSGGGHEIFSYAVLC